MPILKCPNCSTLNSFTARCCRHCGTKLRNQVTNYSDKDSKKIDTTKNEKNEKPSWSVKRLIGYCVMSVIGVFAAFIFFQHKSFYSNNVNPYEFDSVDVTECDNIGITEVEKSGNKKGKLSIDFSSIRKKIGEWDEVKIITVTDSGQGAAIYGRNGFVCHSNKALSSKLHNLNKKGKSIDDVNTVGKNSYVIIYAKNGYATKGAPQSFIEKLHEYNSARETILSASFNTQNEWVIITDKHYSWSNSDIRDFISSAQEQYGNVNYMFISDFGKVACCERGILYEKLPENVEKAINDFDKTARIIKFTDGGKYCIATGNGASIYNI